MLPAAMSRNEEEEAYFRQQEADRREKKRRELAKQAAELEEKRKIAEAAGTDDLELADRIKALGFDGETARVFDLLPLIHVAWADGKIQKDERAAIFRVLESRGLARDSEPFHFVESLLEARPAQQYLDESIAVLREVAGAEEAQNIVDLCVAVAAVSGGFFGFGKTIDEEERALIEKIAAQLGEDGQSAVQREMGK